jgi:hypothetical protein
MVFFAVERTLINAVLVIAGLALVYSLLIFLRVQMNQSQITLDSQGVHFIDRPYFLPRSKVNLPYDHINSFSAGCDGIIFDHSTGRSRLKVLFRTHHNNIELMQVRNALREFGVKEVPSEGLGPSLDPASTSYVCP